MEARIGACEAATHLATQLDRWDQPKLAEKLVVLENQLQLFPVGLAVNVTVKLMKNELNKLLTEEGDESLTEPEVYKSTKTLFSTLAFWEEPSADQTPGLMDHEAPSLYPIYDSIVQKISQDDDVDGDDDDADFSAMMKKQRVLEKQDSQDSQLSDDRLALAKTDGSELAESPVDADLEAS